MSAFVTLEEVMNISGGNYTADEQERIETLLPLVSDALRNEAIKVGKNLDDMIAEDESGAYESVVKLVTTDVIVRVLTQANQNGLLSQESQSALGYSWSGTYAIPGGGVAQSIMKNDLKRLGLRRQRFGVMETWTAESEE